MSGRPGGRIGGRVRRRVSLAIAAVLSGATHVGRANPPRPDPRWYEAALAMRRQAESWGDQAYGAVLVRDDRVIGNGPSRVVLHRDPDAHAEREAIRDALERFGPAAVRGAVLVSTSRPCAVCERAAAQAGVARMFFGARLEDAGAPAGSMITPREPDR